MKTLQAKIQMHPKLKVPKRVYDLQMPTSRKKPERIARDILKEIAPQLKVKADLSELKFEGVKESILGKHVLFQQQFHNQPVSDAWIKINIDKQGKIYYIVNTLLPKSVFKKAEKLQVKRKQPDVHSSRELTADSAKEMAINTIAVTKESINTISEPELVYCCHHAIPVLCYKVIVTATKPSAAWKMYIDAISGIVVNKVDLFRYLDGMGRVFDPNPIAISDLVSLKIDSIPATAYRDVVLRELTGNGMLDGPYVSTSITPNRVKKHDHQFLFDRTSSAFREVMAYYHIDTVHRYIIELGFGNLLNEPIKVKIDGLTIDNSKYCPLSNSILLGEGDIDDAEDAEVIIHEYGHAIQDAIIDQFGQGAEAQAISEAFGDYLAASFFYNKKHDLFRPTFASWGAVFSPGNTPGCLRKLDSFKKYEDRSLIAHEDCEIWSACLWQIRQALGGKAADTLIIASYHLLLRQATFEDGAMALIVTDQQLNHGANKEMIVRVFMNRGILIKPV